MSDGCGRGGEEVKMEGAVAHGLLPWQWVPYRPAEDKLIPVFLAVWHENSSLLRLSAAPLCCQTSSPRTSHPLWFMLPNNKNKKKNRFHICCLLYADCEITLRHSAHTAVACAHRHKAGSCAVNRILAPLKTRWHNFPFYNAPLMCRWQFGGCDLCCWKIDVDVQEIKDCRWRGTEEREREKEGQKGRPWHEIVDRTFLSRQSCQLISPLLLISLVHIRTTGAVEQRLSCSFFKTDITSNRWNNFSISYWMHFFY